MSSIGKAYQAWLTPEEQKALSVGMAVLIDALFDDVMQMQDWEPEDLAQSNFLFHLPLRYLPKYTPLFLKQFFVCVLTVSWKLAQQERFRLASVAEELAAWAIVTAAKSQIEVEYKDEGGELDPEDAFEVFIEQFFEDTDFLFLFEAEYDGIDQSAVGHMLAMSSLSFEDWLKPFGSDPSYIAHPYAARE